MSVRSFTAVVSSDGKVQTLDAHDGGATMGGACDVIQAAMQLVGYGQWPALVRRIAGRCDDGTGDEAAALRTEFDAGIVEGELAASARNDFDGVIVDGDEGISY